MKLYFLPFALCGMLILSAWKTGPSSLADAKAIIKDTVIINGKVWMKSNLALPSPNSFWYDRDSLVNKLSGRLYFFSAAQQLCPRGWHIPSDQEWDEMIAFLGADSLSALPRLLDGGDSGLNLTLSGYRSANSKSDLFGNKGQWGFYWTSTVRGEQLAYARWLNSQTGKFTSNYYRRANGFSVRYVKD